MIRCSKPIYYTLFFIGNLSLGDGLRSAFMKYACKINKKSTTIGCFVKYFAQKRNFVLKKFKRRAVWR